MNQIVFNLEPTAEHPRNSEGAFVDLKDGRILYVYSQFYAGNHDHSPAHLAAMTSSDGGMTWSAPYVVVENTVQNVMCVSLLRLHSGAIAMFYMIRVSNEDGRTHMVVSHDEGQSWSAPKRIIDAPGYFVVNNDRVIQLSSGRLIVPAAFHRQRKPGELDYRGIAMWFLSDDEGVTWRESRTWWAAPKHEWAGLQEPGVVELADGSILSWARTELRSQYMMRSTDGGETFSPPEPSELVSPCGPASIKRLPDSAALLAIYNDHSGRFPLPKQGDWRNPLVAAISTDGGRTFPKRTLLEDDPEGGFHYTAIHYVGQDVLLAYCAGNKTIGWLNRLRIRRISLSNLSGS